MLIGSRALEYWNPNFKTKPNADWDFIGEQTVPVPKGAMLGDMLSAGDLETLSCHLGRIGHEKARQNSYKGSCK